jgi:hypothetical protein
MLIDLVTLSNNPGNIAMRSESTQFFLSHVCLMKQRCIDPCPFGLLRDSDFMEWYTISEFKKVIGRYTGLFFLPEKDLDLINTSTSIF